MRMIAILLGIAAALTWAASAGAQTGTGPAEAIRVMEQVDPATGRAARIVVEDLAPAEILRLQIQLARAGFDPRSRSQRLDDPTRRSLARFQAARGLEVCGCVTYETVVALGIVPFVVARFETPHSAPGAYSTYSSWSYRETVVPYVIYRSGRYTGPAVVVGHGPGVFVGHEPAVGAGRYGRRDAPRRDSHRGTTWRRPTSSRPEPPSVGRRIVTGDGNRD